MSEPVVYFNGRLMPASEAKLDISDTGFLHGASTFTTMRAHNGVVFRLGAHLARLLGTARLLGLRTDATEAHLAEAVGRVLSANGLAEARMRITLTPGPPDGEHPTTLVTAEALPEYPASWYEKGISVAITGFKQVSGSPMFGHKTGCYLSRMLARQEAAAKGCDEALWFTPENRLAEACFCNVFLVLGGEVFTPPLDTPVLDGIVRGAVIELCGELGIACRQDRALTIRELLDAEEMFLTASCSGIRPVVRVERHAVGTEKPGPLTRRVMAAWADLLDRECGAGGERDPE